MHKNPTRYGMLLLVGIGLAATPGIAAMPAPRSMTPAQLDEFATHYYLHPRPELIAAAIEGLDSSRFLEPGVGSPIGPRLNGYFWTFVGFFAEVFAANPDRVDEWQKLGRKQEWQTRDCLQAALKYSQPGALLAVNGPWVLRPGAILSLGNSWGSADEARWGAFFASGNAAYLRKVVAQLREIDPRDPTVVSLAPMWSLARQAPEHPLVRTTLEAARADADPHTRALIDDLLTKDVEAIRKQVADLAPSSFAFDPYPSQKGLRDAGYYGPVSPGQEIHPK